jgi:hypothetical protein
MTISLGGARLSSKLMITTTPWEMTDSYKKSSAKKIKKSTQKFFDDLSDKSIRKPSLGDVIWFQLFKKMTALSKNSSPADYDYYKDKNNYFYAAKVNPFYTLIGKLIASLAVNSMKKQVRFE